jgi:imidazolonepropionase-like amidohydrolase
MFVSWLSNVSGELKQLFRSGASWSRGYKLRRELRNRLPKNKVFFLPSGVNMKNQTGVLAVVGGTICDGNGGPPIENGVIIVQDKRIIAVGHNSIAVPRGAQIIPATGKYIIPGLMDANVHLYFEHSAGELVRSDGRYEDIIARGARRALQSGLTTVFDTWGPREALTHVRDDINRGEIIGSRIFFAGNIIGLGGPTSTEFYPATRADLTESEANAIDLRWEQGAGSELLWMTPAEVRCRVRAYIEGGQQDFLKYASSSHSHMQFICLSEEVQRVIVDEAHRAALTVQAHSTSPESLRMEIEAGADLLQHADLTGLAKMPEETLRIIAQRQIPCAALFVTRKFLDWVNVHMPQRVRTIYRIKDENDRRLVKAGARVLLTTDSVNILGDAAENPLVGPVAGADESPFLIGQGHFHWLAAAVELGMTPMDALVSATRSVARAYKVDKDLGTLERGKIADLIILNENPLATATNYRSIKSVIKEGQLIERESAPELHL